MLLPAFSLGAAVLSWWWASHRRRKGIRRPWAVPAAVLAGVIALPVALLIVTVERPSDRARMERARFDIERLERDGLEPFRQARGRYPTPQEGLSVLVEQKLLKANAPDGTIQDPWGRVYVYEAPGRLHPDRFDLATYGADGEPGGEGENADIRNHR